VSILNIGLILTELLEKQIFNYWCKKWWENRPLHAYLIIVSYAGLLKGHHAFAADRKEGKKTQEHRITSLGEGRRKGGCSPHPSYTEIM